jgi:hypothetical protein
MFLPIFSSSGLTRSNTAGVAAAHDRQRRRLGADLAAGDRRVDVVGAELGDPRANFFVAIGEIELMSTTVLRVPEPLALRPAATPFSPNSTSRRRACRAPW